MTIFYFISQEPPVEQKQEKPKTDSDEDEDDEDDEIFQKYKQEKIQALQDEMYGASLLYCTIRDI